MLQFLLYRHRRFFFQAIGHRAGDAHHDQHDAQMNDEAAVAPLIAPRQSDQTAEDAFAGDALARAQRQRGVVKNRTAPRTRTA